jgi:hypothetical protein
LTGPQGPIGLTGPQGPKGDTGATGNPTTPHHALHEPGGSDYLVNSVWLNKANVFTGLASTGNAQQYISGPNARLVLTDTSQPANAQKFQIALYGQVLYISGVNDAETTGTPNVTLDRSGNLIVSALIRSQAVTRRCR